MGNFINDSSGNIWTADWAAFYGHALNGSKGNAIWYIPCHAGTPWPLKSLDDTLAPSIHESINIGTN